MGRAARAERARRAAEAGRQRCGAGPGLRGRRALRHRARDAGSGPGGGIPGLRGPGPGGARRLGCPPPAPQRGWPLCGLFGPARGTSGRLCGGLPAAPEPSASPFRRPLPARPQAAGRDAPAGRGGRLRQCLSSGGRLFLTTECSRNEQVSAEEIPSISVLIEKRTGGEKPMALIQCCGVNPGVQKRDLYTHFLGIPVCVSLLTPVSFSGRSKVT